MWKFWERSAARLAVGDDPRIGFMLKYSDCECFIDKSRKLKLLGPKFLYPQCPRKLGGCIAAKGDDVSIVNCLMLLFGPNHVRFANPFCGLFC